jgi:hypothetical protein
MNLAQNQPVILPSLFTALLMKDCVENLVISLISINDDAMGLLCKYVSSSKALSSLDVGFCDISFGSCSSLASAIVKSNVTHLDMSSSCIDNTGLSVLLGPKSRISHLNLSSSSTWCHLEPNAEEGFRIFGLNTSLKELDISSCSIILMKQVEILARAIAKHPLLERLIIGSIYKQNLACQKKICDVVTAFGNKKLEAIVTNGKLL